MVAGSLPQAEDSRSDADLLQVIASERDMRAFRALFERYAPRLKAHFVRNTRSEAQAEDLVQDVLLSVWHHASSYQAEKASVSTWIFRIARNRWIDLVRKQRYVQLGPDALALDSNDPHPPLDELLSERELGVRAMAALAALSAEQLEVVQGSYFLHESASELSDRLAIPVGTVKSRLRAALQSLRMRLFDEEGA